LIETDDLTAEAGFVGAEQLFNDARHPTALFVSNYELLPGLLDYCRDHAIRIPDDLSVICFDDPWAAASMEPPITVVRPATEEVGRLGAELIIDLVEGRQPPQCQRLLAPQLIVRGSTRPYQAGE